MKNRLRKYSLTLLFCSFCCGTVWSFVPTPVLHKTVVKNFYKIKKEQLIIDNQYGNVEVKTWRERNIRIIITISTQAQGTQLKKLVNLVHIQTARDEHTISCRTGIDTGSTLSKMQSSVSYVLYLPNDLPLTIKNKFGDIKTGDYAGTLNIDEKFGDFTAGNLSAVDQLILEQGSMTIDGLHTGKITAKGFNSIKIASVSRSAAFVFSSGNQLDVGCGDKIDSIDIKADNIRRFNIRGLNGVPVKFKLQTKMVKWFNGSDVIFKPLKLSFAPRLKILKDSLRLKDEPKDTLRQADPDAILDKKKKLADVMLRKKSDIYEGGTDDAKGRINVEVAFSVLYILK